MTGGRRTDVVAASSACCTLLAARAVLAHRGLPGLVSQYRLAAVDAPLAIEPCQLAPTTRRRMRIVQRVARLPTVRATCLPTSVAIATALNAEGVVADIVIGVRNDAGFQAHAWVEVPGWRFDPSRLPAGAFREIARFRSQARAR